MSERLKAYLADRLEAQTREMFRPNVDPTMNYAAPDYIEAPFTAEWGTPEWIADASARIERARLELVKAAEALLTQTDLGLAFAHAHELGAKADAVVRTKWMLREVTRAIEVRQEPFCICGRPISQCDGSRKGCVSRHTPEGTF